MILDFGSFTRRGLMVDHESSTETWRRGMGQDKAWKEKRVQDQKAGGERQRETTDLPAMVIDP